MNCPICGKENLDSHVLCSFCGNSLRGGVGAEQTPSYQPSEATAPAYQQPTTPPMYQQTAYQQTYQYQPQSPYQQPMYQQPMYQQPYGYGDSNLEEPVTIGEWISSMLICCIPIVGFIMMFVWAFGSDTKKSKANFYKASLLMSAIVLGIYIVFFVILFGAIM